MIQFLQNTLERHGIGFLAGSVVGFTFGAVSKASQVAKSTRISENESMPSSEQPERKGTIKTSTIPERDKERWERAASVIDWRIRQAHKDKAAKDLGDTHSVTHSK